MIGVRNRSARVAFTAVLLPALVVARSARAEVAVSIQYESEHQLDLAERVKSELAAEGYSVRIGTDPEPSPCDANSTAFVPVAERTTVWIRLRAGASDEDGVVASICYLGTLPFLQRASVRAPSADPQQLAVAAAEAVNGLRSKLPPWAGNGERAATPEKEPPKDDPPPERTATERAANSLLVGTSVTANLPDFPAAPGVVGRGTLGISPSAGIMMDTFVPTTGRDIASAQVTATVRTTWLRVGPRFHWGLGDFDVSGAALAGPAITWATAVARAPRLGTADVTTGAVLSLAALVEYPRNAVVFACASASASALLPGVRVNLADGASTPRGSWPLEASIGFGARWGGER